jgi:hypothetical protein
MTRDQGKTANSTPLDAFQPDPTLEALVGARDRGAAVGLAGFLSRDGDRLRIYHDVSLNSYVEVAETDVIHVVELPNQEGIRRHRVFVPKTAPIRRVTETVGEAGETTASVGRCDCNHRPGRLIARDDDPRGFRPVTNSFMDVFADILTGGCGGHVNAMGAILGWIGWLSDHNADGRFDDTIDELNRKLDLEKKLLIACMWSQQ